MAVRIMLMGNGRSRVQGKIIEDHDFYSFSGAGKV